jgi:hypothetical protein
MGNKDSDKKSTETVVEGLGRRELPGAPDATSTSLESDINKSEEEVNLTLSYEEFERRFVKGEELNFDRGCSFFFKDPPFILHLRTFFNKCRESKPAEGELG